MRKIKLTLVTLVTLGLTACTNMDDLMKRVSWEKDLNSSRSIPTSVEGQPKFEEVEIEILDEEDIVEGVDAGDIGSSEDFIGAEPVIKPEVIKHIPEENGVAVAVKPKIEPKKGGREFPMDRMAQGKDKKIYLDNENVPYTGDFVLLIGGKIEYREAYVRGVLNGNKIWYGEEGQVGLIEPYVNGKKEGTQISYYESGAMRSKIDYKAGRLNGNIEWYDRNGKLINRSKIVNGNGTWIVYSHNGKLREKGIYKGGRRDGIWLRYLEDGSLEKKDIYKNGKLAKREWY